MLRRPLCTALLLGFTLFAGPIVTQAAPAVGDALPRLVLGGEDEGLMRVRGDDVAYTRFDSSRALAGKVTLLSYVAARKSAKTMGDVLGRFMRKRRTPLSHFRPVTVMNLDDSTFGTGVFARGLFEDRAVAEGAVMHVLDETGRGVKRWGATREGMLVYVLDPQGRVLLKERAPLSADALQRIGSTIDAAIAKVR